MCDDPSPNTKRLPRQSVHIDTHGRGCQGPDWLRLVGVWDTGSTATTPVASLEDSDGEQGQGWQEFKEGCRQDPQGEASCQEGKEGVVHQRVFRQHVRSLGTITVERIWFTRGNRQVSQVDSAPTSAHLGGRQAALSCIYCWIWARRQGNGRRQRVHPDSSFG
jgi:hypothetical protein